MIVKRWVLGIFASVAMAVGAMGVDGPVGAAVSDAEAAALSGGCFASEHQSLATEQTAVAKPKLAWAAMASRVTTLGRVRPSVVVGVVTSGSQLRILVGDLDGF